MLAIATAASLLAIPSLAAASEFVPDVEESISAKGAQETAVVLTVDGASAECSTATFSGTLGEPAETLTVHPEFSGCTAFGFLSASITTTGCNYVLDAGEETAEEVFAGSLDISCESGKSIKLVASTCEVTIGAQTGLGSMSYSDHPANAPEDFTWTTSTMKVAVTKVKDGFLCPLSGTGSGTGTLAGTALVMGFVGAEQVGLRVGRKTRLCQEAPAGGVCPVGKSYSGTIEGSLVGGPAVLPVFNSKFAEIGQISCASSIFKGKFQRNGASAAGEGITSFKFETAGHAGKCTSTLAGNPDVLVAPQSLPYTASRFEYNPGGGATGTLTLRKAKVNGIAVNLEIGANPPCDYRLNPVRGTVTNGGAETKFKLGVNWPLFEGNEACPAQFNWPNLQWRLTRTEGVGGPLFLAER